MKEAIEQAGAVFVAALFTFGGLGIALSLVILVIRGVTQAKWKDR